MTAWTKLRAGSLSLAPIMIGPNPGYHLSPNATCYGYDRISFIRLKKMAPTRDFGLTGLSCGY